MCDVAKLADVHTAAEQTEVDDVILECAERVDVENAVAHHAAYHTDDA